MADGGYDNKNRGVLWKPHPDQQFAGQGNIDIEGRSYRAVMVKERLSRDGDLTYCVYVRLGPLFVNDRGGDNAPKFSGPIDPIIVPENKRFAAWAKEKDGKHYLSLSVSDRLSDAQEREEPKRPANQGFIDDEIPF